ncbi:MAG: hypothetical protein HY961_11315 [Ignavibacteriae bacterium]|nr:hypothetical protein [Ignavibacteriota bacterium]
MTGQSVRENFVLRGLVVLIVCTACGNSIALAQSPAPQFPPRDDVPEIVSFFAPVLFPKLIQDGFQLKEYVRSEEFAEFRTRFGDLYAVDAIFDEAMRLSWNNVYEALLISLVATMDHSKFGVKLPVVGALLWVPLTSEFDEEFSQRVAALPRRLYADSPPDGAGDRDKLQHFFGSAFLAYTFESREAAERVGDFIEWGEDKVIVDGALDERDFRSNRHGQEFGMSLLDDDGTMPSQFLKYSVVHRVDDTTPPSSPGTLPATDLEKR